MPAARGGIGGGERARPLLGVLRGEREVGAAQAERCEPVRRRVRVGLLDALGRPVRGAVGAYVAGTPVLVEDLDERPDGLGGIVAVQEVEVDGPAEAFDRVLEVAGDGLRRKYAA